MIPQTKVIVNTLFANWLIFYALHVNNDSPFLNVKQKNKKLKQKNAKLKDKNSKLKEKNKILSDKNEEILSSRSWKIT